LGAGLRKHAEKLEQDDGGRHAGDAAGVEGRRDLDEIGAYSNELRTRPARSIAFNLDRGC
jgi:hypothetical protein